MGKKRVEYMVSEPSIRCWGFKVLKYEVAKESFRCD